MTSTLSVRLTFAVLGFGLTGCLLPLFSSSAQAANPPIINEFVFNYTGTDDAEYVEVLGEPLTDYGDYTLIQIESDGTDAGVIYTALQLAMTDPDGFYLPGFFFNEFENGTASILLVKNFIGYNGQDLDTDNDGILDITPWSSVADSVAVLDSSLLGQTYGSPVLTPNYDPRIRSWTG